MNVEAALSQIKRVQERNYRFIRTESGKYYDTYVKNGFVSIGWNEITYLDIFELPEPALKEKIAKSIGIKNNTKENKGKLTNIYNKLFNFNNLKKGDIVVIPSSSSDIMMIGEIENNHIFEEIEGADDCDNTKRRAVRWLKEAPFNNFNAGLYKIKSNQHSLSSLNRFADIINGNIEKLYYDQDDNVHFIFDVKIDRELSILELAELVNNMRFLFDEVNKLFDFGEDLHSINVSLAFNSPGYLNFVKKQSKTVGLVGLLLLTTGCSIDEMDNPNKGLEPEQVEEIREVKDSIDSLRRLVIENR